jgi:Ca2+/H+ antiporter, TMEM165/GDT1 family
MEGKGRMMQMNWKLITMAFGLLFLAELGDKTQLAVFTLVTQHKDPWSVFLGASAALIVVTMLGAFFGHTVTRYVPTVYLQVGAGLLFFGIGLVVLWRAVPELTTYLATLK